LKFYLSIDAIKYYPPHTRQSDTSKMASHLNSASGQGINIGRDQSDASFRYQMPRLALKPEKNKTLVTNLDEVAKALGVDPLWLVKYFTYHVGLQVTYDKDAGSATFPGKRTEPDLSQCLKEFITQFVLCPTCELPELAWTPKPKRDEVEIVCSACQHTSVLSQRKHTAFDKLLVYICSEATKAKDAAKKAGKKATMGGAARVVEEAPKKARKKATEEVAEELPTSSLVGWSDGSSD